jgi:hypothetical protein
LILVLTVGLSASVSRFVGWVREPTYEERNRALDEEENKLFRRAIDLQRQLAPEEEVKQTWLEEERKREEIKELKEQWRYRYDSRLEHFRQELKRRLGW